MTISVLIRYLCSETRADVPLVFRAESVRVQGMGMEVAVRGDVMLLKQAMLKDPLVSEVCNPGVTWRMTDELLVAQAQ